MPIIPRLWMARDGRTLECDEIDASHASIVVRNAAAFGLSEIGGQLERMYDSDDFDFDLAIALGEAAGWTRISRDAGGSGGIAVSSACAMLAAAAVRRIEVSHGVFVENVDVEISDLETEVLFSRHYGVKGHHFAPFRRHGRLPAPCFVGRRPVVPLRS